MWTVVHIAGCRTAAEGVKARLENEGLLVMLRPVHTSSSGDDDQVELLVPEAEAEEAQEVLSALRQR